MLETSQCDSFQQIATNVKAYPGAVKRPNDLDLRHAGVKPIRERNSDPHSSETINYYVTNTLRNSILRLII